MLADYRTLGEQALAGLEGLQGVEETMDLGDLGTHPMHLIANAFAFDHYTHIRVDVLAPVGRSSARPRRCWRPTWRRRPTGSWPASRR